MRSIPTDPWVWVRNRTLPLLLALVALIALHPIFMDTISDQPSPLFPLAFASVPLFGLVVLGSWKRALPLVAVFFGMIGWAWFGYRFDLEAISRSPLELLATAYFAYAAIATGAVVLRSTAVLDDRVYGGLAVYLLIACMYATLHRHTSAIDPNAYWSTTEGKACHLEWDDALYYSCMTITTVGFGDIVPRSSWSRAATMLEAASGVFVTVVFIARLATTPSHPGTPKHPTA